VPHRRGIFHFAPDGKPLRTFPGIAVFAYAIPDGKPLRTFPGIAVFLLTQFRTENRCALFLELL